MLVISIPELKKRQVALRPQRTVWFALFVRGEEGDEVVEILSQPFAKPASKAGSLSLEKYLCPRTVIAGTVSDRPRQGALGKGISSSFWLGWIYRVTAIQVSCIL